MYIWNLNLEYNMSTVVFELKHKRILSSADNIVVKEHVGKTV